MVTVPDDLGKSATGLSVSLTLCSEELPIRRSPKRFFPSAEQADAQVVHQF
jgi:hypothetical protein